MNLLVLRNRLYLDPITLILISAFFHAVWNALLKYVGGNRRTLLAASLVSWVTVVAIGMIRQNLWMPSLPVMVYALASGLCEGLYFIFLARAFRSGKLGITYAFMRSVAMLMVYVVSVFFLGESVTRVSMLGVLFIFLGIWLCQAALSFKGLLSGVSSGGSPALWAAVCIMGYHIAYDLALKEGMSPEVLYMVSVSVASALLFVGDSGLHSRRGFVEFIGLFWPSHRQWWFMMTMGVTMGLSFLLFLFSLTMMEPGMAISLRNTSMVFALLLGISMGERLSLRQALGVLVLAVGAFLVSS